MTHHKLIILGSGAAGMTAAIYAARAALSPLVISGAQPGGQLTIAGEVENYPGFQEAIGGDLLTQNMAEQAERFGTEVVYDTIEEVDTSVHPFVLKGADGEWTCDALVISTGATARWLGIPGESQYKGVSACATCDGFFFKGQDVVVIGGGNTAVEEALHLAKLCKTVHLVHRRGELRAEAILQARLAKKENVVFHWNTAVEEIFANKDSDHVAGVKLVSTVGGEDSVLEVQGVFVAIGHDPATSLFKGKIELDSSGYMVVEKGGSRTSIDGVFAAGDVADPRYRQAVTAAGMGCMAALDAERWLSER
jgi:thioredoxin reductase (NADPH)